MIASRSYRQRGSLSIFAMSLLTVMITLTYQLATDARRMSQQTKEFVSEYKSFLNQDRNVRPFRDSEMCKNINLVKNMPTNMGGVAANSGPLHTESQLILETNHGEFIMLLKNRKVRRGSKKGIVNYYSINKVSESIGSPQTFLAEVMGHGRWSGTNESFTQTITRVLVELDDFGNVEACYDSLSSRNFCASRGGLYEESSSVKCSGGEIYTYQMR